MSGADSRWRERCERYFSSMAEASYKIDKVKSKKPRKKKKKEDGYKVYLDDKSSSYPSQKQKPYHATTFSNKRQPLKGVVRWLSGLDIHGTSMLLRTRSHLYSFFWMFLSIAACALFGVFVYIFLYDYYHSSTKFRVEITQANHIASPLILTICNSNLIRKSKIAFGTRFFDLQDLNISDSIQNVPVASITQVLRNSKLSAFLEEVDLDEKSLVFSDLQQEFGLYSGMLTDSDWSYIASASLQANFDPFLKALRLTSSEISDFGHKMDSSILQCTKNGRECQAGEVIYNEIRDYGQCAHINLSLEDSWLESAVLTVDVESEEYLDDVSPEPGILAVVHSSSSSSPLSLSSAMLAQPGSGLRLSVSKVKEVKRRSSNCESENGYSRTECIRRCLESTTVDLCGCSIGLENLLSQRCRVNLQYEFICHRLLEMLAQSDQLPCDCKHRCREDIIDVISTPLNWIVPHSESRIRASLKAAGVTKNFTDLRQSLTKIEVLWSNGKYEKLEEEEDITIIKLLLNIGALSALTAGVSVVTAIELLWLLGKLMVSACCSVVKTGEQKTNVEMLSPYAMQAVYDNSGNQWMAYSGEGANAYGAKGPYQDEGGPNYIMAPEGHHHEVPDDGFILVPSSVDPYFNWSYVYDEDDDAFRAGGSRDLNPILEEKRNTDDLKAVSEEYEERNDLFSHAWERTGQSRPHQRVHVMSHLSGADEVPLFNAPNTSLKEQMNGGKSLNKTGLGVESVVPYSTDSFAFPDPPDEWFGNKTNDTGEEVDQTSTSILYPPLNNYRREPQADISHAEEHNEKNVSKNITDPAAAEEPIFTISNGENVADDNKKPNDQPKPGPHLEMEPVTSHKALPRLNLSFSHYNESSRQQLNHLVAYQGISNSNRNRFGLSTGGNVLGRHNKGFYRALGETAPVKRSNFFNPSRQLQPNTWHNQDPLGENGQGYKPSAYDGRTALYRPKASYFAYPGGGGMETQHGETVYFHS